MRQPPRYRQTARAVKAPANKKSKILLRVLAASFTLALLSLAIFLVHSYRSYAKLVDARLAHGYLVSRAGIYAAPRTLCAGQKYSRDNLAAILKRSGYVEDDIASEIWNGSFAIGQNFIDIRATNGNNSAETVRVTFGDDGRIRNLSREGVELESILAVDQPDDENRSDQ